MRSFHRSSIRWMPLALVAIAANLACSGGESGGGVALDGGCLDLAASAPGSNSVSLTKGASSCQMLDVDVVVTDVTDVFASSFTLTYDPTLAHYEGASTAGSVLASDGATVEVLEQAQNDSVAIGLTRLGVANGVNAAGTQLLVRLTFSTTADAGDAGIGFSDEAILGSETPPVEKTTVQWLGGTLVVR